jgi:hypothetical protein
MNAAESTPTVAIAHASLSGLREMAPHTTRTAARIVMALQNMSLIKVMLFILDFVENDDRGFQRTLEHRFVNAKLQ